jgi:[protein-PII] uridylyltransferase
VRAALADRPAPDVEAFVASVPSGYLHWVEPADAPAHLGLLVPRPAAGEVRVDIRPGRAEGVHRVAVASRDRPGLLAALAGAFSVAGLSILAAQVFTTPEGVVLDVFDVRPAFREEADEARWDRLRTAMAAAAAGAPSLAARVRDIAHHTRAVPEVSVTVRVDRDASDFYAVVEVGAADRPGLLFDLAEAFADAQTDVHLAKVATYGPRVVDVFYVTDLAGHKPAETAELEAALRRAARG